MTLPGWLRWLFWPASVVFEGVVRIRAWLYRCEILGQRRLNGVVISVGNLTVGGTGKTPMVMWLVERLLAEGRRVGILTRGYHGSSGESIPLPASAPLRIFSDEVWLFWKRYEGSVMLGVGANRFAWGRRLEQAGAEWFVLDDGFQHLRLARNVDIVLIDATDPFGGGLLLPAGRLREPRSALARADIVVISRTEHAPAVEAIVRRHTPAPVFYAQTEPGGIFARDASLAGPPQNDWRQKKFFAFCAIGNPIAFLDDLRRWGLHVAGHAAFRDHHRFSQRDGDEIGRRALAAGAEALLSTEKDVFNYAQAQFKLPVFYCRIAMRISEPDRFWQTVTEAARRKLGARP